MTSEEVPAPEAQQIEEEITKLEEEDTQSILALDSDSDSDESESNSSFSSTNSRAHDSEEEEEEGQVSEKEEEPVDFEEEATAASGPLKTKNEISELPKIVPFDMASLPVNAGFALVGKATGCVDDLIIVEATSSGEEVVLDSETVLFILTAEDPIAESNEQSEGANSIDTPEQPVQKMTPLGRVWDVFGPVSQPFYSVRFNSNSESDTTFKGLAKDQPVFYVPNLSKIVLTKPLKEMKGTDASNFYDEEVGVDELDFSDDEKEQEFKKNLKRKKNGLPEEAHSRKRDSKENSFRNKSSASSSQHQPPQPQQYQAPHQIPPHSHDQRVVTLSTIPVKLPYPEFNSRQQKHFSSSAQVNPYLPLTPDPLPAPALVQNPHIVEMQPTTQALPYHILSNQESQLSKLAAILKGGL